MTSDCFKASLLPKLLQVSLASLLWVVPAWSQNLALEDLLEESRVAAEAQDWQQALEIQSRAVEEFGNSNPLKTIGPQFGAIYYRKGLSEMKLGKWLEAMKSFEICYRDFPNDRSSDNKNVYQNLALLKWGEAAMGAGSWELAISKFHQFAQGRDRVRDLFPQGSFYVNLSICFYQLGRLTEGNENLEIAIQNLRNFPTPVTGMMGGVQVLAAAAVKKENEQILLDFISKNRGQLILEPYLMSQYTPTLMKLAGDTLSAGMLRAALALYQLVPSLDAAIDDTRSRLTAMTGTESLEDDPGAQSRQMLEDHLAVLEAERRDKQSPEILKLAAVAFIHETKGNLHGAHAAYQQLELYFPHAEKREDYLFNLVRVSARIHAADDTHSHGMLFLREFPRSKFILEIKRMVLRSMFDDGRPAAFLEVAGPMVKDLAEGTAEHDQGLYFLGLSYYQSARFEEAGPVLERHMVLYPKSEWAIPVAFYQASNLLKLQQWEEAAKSFDLFLATYPDHSNNGFLPNAIYERAACHFAAGEMGAALEKLDRIAVGVGNRMTVARATLLKGRVLHAMGRREEAIPLYQKLLKDATAASDREIIEEALVSSIVLLGELDGESHGELTTLADRYWKEFSESSVYQCQVAVSQVAAFRRAGRGDEALERLRQVLTASAGHATDGEVAELIRYYTDAYLFRHSAEELETHYANFPEGIVEKPSTRALLRIEVIGAYERMVRESQNETQVRMATGKIKGLYQALRNEFSIQSLPSRVILRLADHLRTGTSTPREALVCYDELIARNDPTTRFQSLLGRGDLRGRESGAEEISKGQEDFAVVYHESKNADEREYALFRMIGLDVARGEFAKAAERAGEYLREESSFHAFEPQVKLLLAKCYIAKQLNEEALAIYEPLWKNHAGQIDVSGPAMVQWMQLVWARDRPGDREAVIHAGNRFLKSIDWAQAGDSMSRSEIEQLVSGYQTRLALQPDAPTRK